MCMCGGAVEEKEGGGVRRVNERLGGVNRGRESEGRRGRTAALWGDEYSCAERQSDMHKQ